MKEPTMEEVLKLVEFDRNEDGSLRIKKVLVSVWGDVRGNVWGSVEGSVVGSVEGDVHRNVGGCVRGSVGGTVEGTINGRRWQYVDEATGEEQ